MASGMDVAPYSAVESRREGGSSWLHLPLRMSILDKPRLHRRDTYILSSALLSIIYSPILLLTLKFRPSLILSGANRADTFLVVNTERS